MATVDDLKDALKEALERTGKLRKLKAQLRADAFNALASSAVTPQAPLSGSNLVINELIREYLVFNGYAETLSVFLPETGQPQVRPLERSFLASHLNVPDGKDTSQLPLLYAVVEQAHLQPHDISTAK